MMNQTRFYIMKVLEVSWVELFCFDSHCCEGQAIKEALVSHCLALSLAWQCTMHEDKGRKDVIIVMC
jgi:hypothetical protein